jgi:hypothetical protein
MKQLDRGISDLAALDLFAEASLQVGKTAGRLVDCR